LIKKNRTGRNAGPLKTKKMKTINRKKLAELLKINSRQTIINKPFKHEGLDLIAKVVTTSTEDFPAGVYVYEISNKNQPLFKVVDDE